MQKSKKSDDVVIKIKGRVVCAGSVAQYGHSIKLGVDVVTILNEELGIEIFNREYVYKKGGV